MRIGFDLDGVFINKPPFIPRRALAWLYRHSLQELLFGRHSLRELLEEENETRLSYRFPTSVLEQLVRQLSHIPLLRPPMKSNIGFLRHLYQSTNSLQIYLITSRYNFLKSRTRHITQRYNLLNFFKSIYQNTDDEQPHLFKERAIKQLKVDLYVDDDLKILNFLRTHCPGVILLWYNPYKDKGRMTKGVAEINKLEEVTNYLKN